MVYHVNFIMVAITNRNIKFKRFPLNSSTAEIRMTRWLLDNRRFVRTWKVSGNFVYIELR